jgi:hypothetical protein
VRPLTTRDINRATLSRQFLLERSTVPVVDALEHLVGLQAQVPTDPYTALWSRLADFDPLELSALVERRRAVRTGLMRATLHLVSTRDALAIRPVVQTVLARVMHSQFRRQLETVDRDELVEAARTYVEERPRTPGELGRLLLQRWPDSDPTALAQVTLLLPMVQVTPRGTWGASAQAAVTTYESWLGEVPGSDSEPDGLMLRYLAAFGPATHRDAAVWSRLTALAEVFDRLRPRLLVLRDEQGRELFDLPDAPRPDAETPAPVRFLPEYDNLLLSHADRSRVIPDGLGDRFTPIGFQPRGSVLVDGFLAAGWRLDREGSRTTLRIQPVRHLAATERDQVETEASQLLGLLTGHDTGSDVALLASPRV